jgi:hypothetical protein
MLALRQRSQCRPRPLIPVSRRRCCAALDGRLDSPSRLPERQLPCTFVWRDCLLPHSPPVPGIGIDVRAGLPAVACDMSFVRLTFWGSQPPKEVGIRVSFRLLRTRIENSIEHTSLSSGFCGSSGENQGDPAEAEVDHCSEGVGVGMSVAAALDDADLGVDSLES